MTKDQPHEDQERAPATMSPGDDDKLKGEPVGRYYESYWPPYVPVAVRRHRAAQKVAKTKKAADKKRTPKRKPATKKATRKAKR